MAEPYLDRDVVEAGIKWFSGYGPSEIVGACPHRCPHNHLAVIAWGPDFRRYELVQCDTPGPGGCGGQCRGWESSFPHGEGPKSQTWGWKQVKDGQRHTTAARR